MSGLPLKKRVKAVNQPLTMTLISPTIVLDAWGRSQQGFDKSWLSKELGIKVEIVTEKGSLGAGCPLESATETELLDVDCPLKCPLKSSPEKGALSVDCLLNYPLKFARSQVIDSFNNKMGLARHRDMALSAGSAVTLMVKEAISLADLQARLSKIEWQGLGVRRNEGFGRVIFNHPVYQDACQGVEATEIEIPDDLRLGKGLFDTI